MNVIFGRLLLTALLAASTLVLPLARPAAADDVTADQMLAAHNALREAIGAPALPGDPRVVLAAQRHADYLSMNNTYGHSEDPNLPGYSGRTARERVANAGWSTTFVSEVAASYRGAIYALTELWHAPYHRLGMMHPSTIATGWGHSDINDRPSTVGNIVYDFGVRPTEFVRSPAANQVVPPSWSGVESPSPLPPGVRGPVGYPIMVVYAGAPRVDMRGAEIVAPSGALVPFYYVTPQFQNDYQVIIPEQPLAPNTTYHVRFDLTVAGHHVTHEWSFSTSGGGTIPTQPVTPAYSSAFVDQTAWPTLAPGEATTVTVRFRNTGTATWTRGTHASQANLGINGDSRVFADLGMAVNWPTPDRVAIQQEPTVPPGGTATFTFQVRAPSHQGEFHLHLRPVIDGRTWLPDQGVFLVVKSDSGFHGQWHSQSPYPTLAPGQLSDLLNVSFLNTGTRTWVRGTFGQQVNLGINGDDRTWGPLGHGWPTPDRPAIQDQATVAPGAVGSFTFQIRAPQTPGVYRIHLRPVADGTAWLEDYGVFLVVTVR